MDNRWIDDIEKELHILFLEAENAALKGKTPPLQFRDEAEVTDEVETYAKFIARNRKAQEEQDAKTAALKAKKDSQAAKLQALCDKRGFNVTVTTNKARRNWCFFFTTPDGRKFSYDLGYRAAVDWVKSDSPYGLARELAQTANTDKAQ